MKFGSKEWFDKLNSQASFPSFFVFYVDTKGDVFSRELNSKAKDVYNIQYKTIETYRSDFAIASLVECNSDKDYYEECNKLRKIWGKSRNDGR